MYLVCRLLLVHDHVTSLLARLSLHDALPIYNLEVEDMNKLLAQFGIQATNLYTDAKKLVLPKETPVIGGLRWAYYTGNLLLLDPTNPAKPQIGRAHV